MRGVSVGRTSLAVVYAVQFLDALGFALLMPILRTCQCVVGRQPVTSLAEVIDSRPCWNMASAWRVFV